MILDSDKGVTLWPVDDPPLVPRAVGHGRPGLGPAGAAQGHLPGGSGGDEPVALRSADVFSPATPESAHTPGAEIDLLWTTRSGEAKTEFPPPVLEAEYERALASVFLNIHDYRQPSGVGMASSLVQTE